MASYARLTVSKPEHGKNTQLFAEAKSEVKIWAVQLDTDPDHKGLDHWIVTSKAGNVEIKRVLGDGLHWLIGQTIEVASMGHVAMDGATIQAVATVADMAPGAIGGTD